MIWARYREFKAALTGPDPSRRKRPKVYHKSHARIGPDFIGDWGNLSRVECSTVQVHYECIRDGFQQCESGDELVRNLGILMAMEAESSGCKLNLGSNLDQESNLSNGQSSGSSTGQANPVLNLVVTSVPVITTFLTTLNNYLKVTNMIYYYISSLLGV